MNRLLSIEWQKLRAYRTFKVLGILYLLALPITYLSMSYVDVMVMDLMFSDYYVFPEVWNFSTYMAGWFSMFLAMIMVIITCNEFSYRTLRQNVIDGLSRNEALAGKLLLFLTISIFTMLYTGLIALILGFVYSEEPSTVTDGIVFIPAYFVQTLGYMILAYMLGTLVRRGGLGMILFLLTIWGEWIIRQFMDDNHVRLLPMRVFSNLTPLEMSENVKQVADPSYAPFSIETNMLLGLAYIGVFIYITKHNLKTSDL